MVAYGMPVENWARMMEVWSAGSARMAARTLEGSAAAKDAEAWALLAVRLGAEIIG